MKTDGKMESKRNKIEIGRYVIEQIDDDYFLVSNDLMGRTLKVCGGDLETALDVVFITTEDVGDTND